MDETSGLGNAGFAFDFAAVSELRPQGDGLNRRGKDTSPKSQECAPLFQRPEKPVFLELAERCQDEVAEAMACDVARPPKRKLNIAAIVGSPSERARRQFRTSPGGGIEYSCLRRPELPPSSATVTTAVRDSRSRSATHVHPGGNKASFRPRRRMGRPVPPPSATIRDAGSRASRGDYPSWPRPASGQA